MADFCKQCTDDLFPGASFNDLQDISTEKDTKEGKYAMVLCEGCGPTLVDHTGKCISKDCLKQHGMGEIDEKASA